MAEFALILGLISGAASLASTCGSVAKTLCDLASKYEEADLSIRLLVQQVDTLKAAWDRIREWSETCQDPSYSQDQALLKQLDQSLACGDMVMSALEDDLAPFDLNNKKLRPKERSIAVWRDSSLQTHQVRLRDQISSMTLLLQVLDLPSAQDRRRQLMQSELRLRKYDESALSIIPSEVSSWRSASTKRLSTSSQDSIGMAYRRLSFEDLLFTTRVYKRNYRTPQIKSLLCQQDPGNTKVSSKVEFETSAVLPVVSDKTIPQIPQTQGVTIIPDSPRDYALYLKDSFQGEIRQDNFLNGMNLFKEGVPWLECLPVVSSEEDFIRYITRDLEQRHVARLRRFIEQRLVQLLVQAKKGIYDIDTLSENATDGITFSAEANANPVAHWRDLARGFAEQKKQYRLLRLVSGVFSKMYYDTSLGTTQELAKSNERLSLARRSIQRMDDEYGKVSSSLLGKLDRKLRVEYKDVSIHTDQESGVEDSSASKEWALGHIDAPNLDEGLPLSTLT